MNPILAQASVDASPTINMLLMLGTVFIVLVVPGIVFLIIFSLVRGNRRKKRQAASKE